MLRATEAEPAIQRGTSPVRVCAGLDSRAARRDPQRVLRVYDANRHFRSRDRWRIPLACEIALTHRCGPPKRASAAAIAFPESDRPNGHEQVMPMATTEAHQRSRSAKARVQSKPISMTTRCASTAFGRRAAEAKHRVGHRR